MVFSSSIFLFIFLPIVFLAYFCSPSLKIKNTVLLIFSLLFYAWGEPKYIILMILSVFINYLTGILINQFSANQTVKKAVIILSVAINIGLLVYFKYFNFIIDTLNTLLHLGINMKNIALPIGISFFTFQAMSYSIDIYRDEVAVQKNYFDLLLYVSLFPQLIAGPIVRYVDVCNEIDNRNHSLELVSAGARRFVYGLAKKVIVANQVALVADTIFSQKAINNSAAIAWVGIICYAIQIYFDFSGYSDMAIGLGKVFGFHFLENFNYPYISQSMTDFWRRWHISLSTWFRDYLYIPLGGNRKGNVYINLFTVFLLTGIWHGASWNFIAWGLWNGLFLIVERLLKQKVVKFSVPRIIKHLYALLVVLLGWVLFRSQDLTYAIDYVKIMFGASSPKNVGFTVFWYLTPKILFVLILAFIGSVPWRQILKKQLDMIQNKTIIIIADKLCTIFLLILSLIFVMTSTYNPFIYFRF